MTVLRLRSIAVLAVGLGLLLSRFASAAPVVYAQAQIPPVAGGPPAVIALLPFDGKDTHKPPHKPLGIMQTAHTVGESLMTRPQSQYYRVLSPEQFVSITRLRFHGRAADLKAVALMLRANILLGGWLEATPSPDAPKPYRLTLTLYDSLGQVIGQLGYDVDTPALNAQRFTAQATAFFQMLDGALRIPHTMTSPTMPVASVPQQQPLQPWQAPAQQPQQWQPQPGQQTQPWGQPPQTQPWQPQQPGQQAQQAPQLPEQSPSTQPLQPNDYQGSAKPGQRAVSQVDDQEQAPLSDQPLLPRSKEARDLYDRRPPWQSAFDIRLGFLYTTRSLSNEGSDTAFPRAGAPGFYINAELHPLAFMKSVRSPLAGLGLRLSAMVPSWPTIEKVSQQGAGSSGSYKASERRIEFALRWHWNFWNDVLRPDIEVEGLFGDHAFEFSQPMNLPYLSLPSVDYRYLGALLGLRMHFTRWLSARAGFSLAKHLSLGAATTPGVDGMGMSLVNSNGFQSYGPGSGWLFRTDLGLTAEIWRGIIGGFNFYYEQNTLSFEGQGNIMKNDGTAVTRARDEYLGIMLTVGYYFRPFI